MKRFRSHPARAQVCPFSVTSDLLNTTYRYITFSDPTRVWRRQTRCLPYRITRRTGCLRKPPNAGSELFILLARPGRSDVVHLLVQLPGVFEQFSERDSAESLVLHLVDFAPRGHEGLHGG